MLDPYDLEPPESSLDTLRLWISEQQWMAILQDVERSAKHPPPAGRLSQRLHERFPGQFHCIIRHGSPTTGRSGTLLVRTRNISAGGIGFLHGSALASGTRCTLALHNQDPVGRNHGVIITGRVAWCREVSQDQTFLPAYEVGVQFDRTIDVGPFAASAA